MSMRGCHRHVLYPIRSNLTRSATMYVCMYVCMVIYVRATAYSLDCHVGSTDRAAQTAIHRLSYRDASHGDAFISLADCSGKFRLHQAAYRGRAYAYISRMYSGHAYIRRMHLGHAYFSRMYSVYKYLHG